MIKVIHCTVNGKVREIAVDERESLTDMLRLRLGLTSVKKGCEAGECGACTVLIDGVAKNSCILLAVWADGHEIITVEGIRGKNGLLHPVQQAFVDEAAIQCGFCTPGLVLTGVELVNSGKRYTREQLREKISGHLCRCTGYENILNALEKVVGVDSQPTACWKGACYGTPDRLSSACKSGGQNSQSRRQHPLWGHSGGRRDG